VGVRPPELLNEREYTDARYSIVREVAGLTCARRRAAVTAGRHCATARPITARSERRVRLIAMLGLENLFVAAAKGLARPVANNLRIRLGHGITDAYGWCPFQLFNPTRR